MQGSPWTMMANFYLKLLSADSPGREKYSFLKEYHNHKMPELLQFHASVSSFATQYAVFHLFDTRQDKKTLVHDVIVLSVITD